MPGIAGRLLNKNAHRLQNYIPFRHTGTCNASMSFRRFVFATQKSGFNWKETEKVGKGFSSMNMKRPSRALLIFLVGRSRCAEAAENLQEMMYCLARLLSRQCKFHTSQRVYRSLHLYSCYSRMWGEEMTRKVISEMRKSLMIGGKALLMSAVFMTPYDWDKNKITDAKLESCIEEYETVDQLRRATVCCEECCKRQVVDKSIPGVDYCTCKGNLRFVDRSRQFNSWEAFLEMENILVWRRKHHVHNYLYSYKVYGMYEDMSLSAFMETQLNTSFRTQWDTSALELKILNSDSESNSDLMYWLVKFPHFFANRDYVFKRRFHVNERKKEVIILNEIAEHPQFPEAKGIHRVNEYWSIMVLRAKDNFNKPGMSYTLTYFDNPGTSLPSPVTNFIASTAFPDFLQKVYHAAMTLQQRWEDGEDAYVTLPAKLRYPRELKDDVEVPVTDQKPGPIVPYLESDERKTSELLNLEDSMPDPEIDDMVEVSKDTPKIPVRFRKAVVNLLEAIEVVSPEYSEKTALTAKIEAAVNKLGLEKSLRKQLKPLEALRSKTKTFMLDAAKKKEESIRIMKEFERRKYYYEHTSPDATTLLLFAGLLKAVNDVLKADKNMRIGKGFTKDPEERLHHSESPDCGDKESPNHDEMKESFTPPEKDIPTNVNNVNAMTPTLAFCESDSPVSNERRVLETSWYFFSFLYSWWGTKTVEAEEGKDFLSSSDRNQFEESQSWYHYLWIFSPSSRPEGVSKNGTVTNEREGADVAAQCTSDDQGNESIPWYNFPWLFKFWSKENV